MKLHLHAILWMGLVAPIGATRLQQEEADVLRARFDPGLAELRAGKIEQRVPIDEAEREAMRASEASHPELGELRGGILVDVLLIVLVVLLVLILI